MYNRPFSFQKLDTKVINLGDYAMLELPPEVLFGKIPPNLHKRMLFIENWVQPDGFLFLTTDQRMKLRDEIRQVLFSKHRQKHHNGINYPVKYPTPRNAWVWFGSYGGIKLYPDGTRGPRIGFYETCPRIGKHSVRRILYQSILTHFNSDGLAREARLAPVPGTWQSDVSFYKHFPGFRLYGQYSAKEKREFYLDQGIDLKLARMNSSNNPASRTAPTTASGYDDFKEAIKQVCPDSATMLSIGFEMIEKTLRQVKNINNPIALRKAFDALAESGYEDEEPGEYWGEGD